MDEGTKAEGALWQLQTPQGLTPAQATECTRLCTVEENKERFQQGFQRGWEEGDKQINTLKWMAFAIGCCIAILLLLLRC
jgi:hypothetical protein